MRTNRFSRRGLVLVFALALACGTTLGASRVAAEPDRHVRNRDREHRRHETVVRREPAPRPFLHVRTRAPEKRRERRSEPPRRVHQRVVVHRAPLPPRVVVRVSTLPLPPLHRGHYYYDPYCHERFTSLSVYVSHLEHHPHVSFAWMMELGRSRPLYGCRYDESRWVRWEACDH